MKRELRVLITGSTGQLMQHIATLLATGGFEIILNYRSNALTAKKLAKKIGAVRTVRADVTDPAQVAAMFRTIGPVDVLINGVGDFIFKPLSKTTTTEFTECVTSNLMSAWYCTKAVLPSMRKQKFGRIINFGSAGCDRLTARPKTTPYYIGKTALLMLTRSLAKEEAKNGVSINMVSPGVLPHGVRPPGAPIIPYQDVAQAVLQLIQTKSLKTGSNITIARGWRPR